MSYSLALRFQSVELFGLFCLGFICQCKHKPEGLVTGLLCEETTRTFEGGLGTSYIWLKTLVVYERSVVQLEFTTLVANGLLLYQGPLEQGLCYYP